MSIVQQNTSDYGKKHFTRLISNLQFKSNVNGTGEYSFVGAYPYDEGMQNVVARLLINAYIPENFVITEAKITYINIPVNWQAGDGSQYYWGYVRNLKAYKMISSNFYLNAGYYSSFYPNGNEITEEISLAFGVSGLTPSIPTNTSQITETFISGDIKDFLRTGNNTIIIRPETIPIYTGTYTIDTTNCAQITSAGVAILNVLGYTK